MYSFAVHLESHETFVLMRQHEASRRYRRFPVIDTTLISVWTEIRVVEPVVSPATHLLLSL